MIRMPYLLVCFVLLTALAADAGAGIRNAVFDFEGEPVTSNGGLTSLTMTKNGLSISIDRVGEPFDIGSLSTFNGASAFGSRSLAPTPPGGNFFNVNFSQPITHFSAELGDFTGQTTDTLALTAFSGRNGTGSMLGTSLASLPLNAGGVFAFDTLEFSGRGIESIQLIGGTSRSPNSVFFDNFHVTGNVTGSGIGGGPSVVPLPPGIYVMPFCAAIALAAGRKLLVGSNQQTRLERGRLAALKSRFRNRRQYTRTLNARTTRGWEQPQLGDF